MLQDIANIIREEQLCSSWEIENNRLILFFQKYIVNFIYDEYLYCILGIKLGDSDLKDNLKKILINDYRDIFITKKQLCIQTRFQRFTPSILDEQKKLYNEIVLYIKDMLNNNKKNFINFLNINGKINLDIQYKFYPLDFTPVLRRE